MTSVAQRLSEIGDLGLAVDQRLAAIESLAAENFLGPRFDADRPAFLQALRNVATDTEEQIRLVALNFLTLQKDPFAQQLLMQGLQNSAQAVLPDAIALQFLGRDDHAAALPIAWNLLNSASAPEVRVQAVRVLVSDPQAAATLAGLLADQGEAKSVRRAAAAALHALDPASFVALARQIAADPADYADIRTTLRGALARISAGQNGGGGVS